MSAESLYRHGDYSFLAEQELWHLLEVISREAVAATFEQAYVDNARGSVGCIDKNWPLDLPERENRGQIGALLGTRSAPTAKSGRLSLSGAHPAPIDEMVHDQVRERIFSLLGDCIGAAAGEEATAAQWNDFLQLPEGRLGAIIDPVDGTSNARTVRDGFSCNIAIYRSCGRGAFTLLGAVCTNSSQETLTFMLDPDSARLMSPGGTVIDLTGTAFCLDNRMPGTLATVATRGPAREEIGPILDPQGSFHLAATDYGGETFHDPALTVFLTAGAPKMISWPLSGLEYIYVPHDQAVYDAIPMVGVLLAGNSAYYVASTGERATLGEIIAWLSDVRPPKQGQSNNHRTFKAGLLVRDGASPDTTKTILEKIRVRGS